MTKKTIGFRILMLLTTGAHPTLGDMERNLRLPAGTATHQRITELRAKLRRHYAISHPIPCYREVGRKEQKAVYRYFLAPQIKAAIKDFVKTAVKDAA